MNRIRRRRVYTILSIATAVFIAVGLVLYALGKNIDLYYTPSQVAEQHVAVDREIRLGGTVENGSVRHTPNTLNVRFGIVDAHKKIEVDFDGLLPALFREGQGIVTQGHLNARGVFVADEVLAKHDEKYRPQ